MWKIKKKSGTYYGFPLAKNVIMTIRACIKPNNYIFINRANTCSSGNPIYPFMKDTFIIMKHTMLMLIYMFLQTNKNLLKSYNGITKILLSIIHIAPLINFIIKLMVYFSLHNNCMFKITVTAPLNVCNFLKAKKI